MSALSSTTSKVSAMKGEVIPSRGGKAMGDGKGSWKMRWSTELTKDL